MANRDVLSWESEDYLTIYSSTRSSAEIRKEYSRLRTIANKRLNRFKDTEWEKGEIYKQNAGQYIPISQIKSDAQLRRLLEKVAGFVGAETGSVSGLARQRARFIETMHDRGYTFINRDNYFQFTEYMEELKTRKESRLYDSERIAELFEIGERKGIDTDELLSDFENWIEAQDRLDRIPEPKTKAEKRMATADYYRKKLGLT